MSDINGVTRITWTTTTYGTEIGQAGSRNLFTIEDNSTSEKPSFRLRTDLPVTGHRSWRATTPAKLHAHAEKILAAHVAELGAVFPADTEGGDL